MLYIKHKAGRDMRFLLATALVIFALITVVRFGLHSRAEACMSNGRAGTAPCG